jgi:hypothetical protein
MPSRKRMTRAQFFALAAMFPEMTFGELAMRLAQRPL